MLICLMIALAMLSKEQGITVIAICVVHEVFVAQCISPWDLFAVANTAGKAGTSCPPVWLRRLVMLVMAGMVMMMMRLRVMGTQLPVFTKYDNPAAAAGSPARQLTYNYLLTVNWGLLLSPSSLCCDWTMNTVPLVNSLGKLARSYNHTKAENEVNNHTMHGIWDKRQFLNGRKIPQF